MAIRNRKLMHESFPKHWLMGRARMKCDKEKEGNYGKKRSVSMERGKVGKKKRRNPSAYHYKKKKFIPYQSVMLLLLSNNFNKHSPWMLSLEIFWSACAAAADYRQIRCRPPIPAAAS